MELSALARDLARDRYCEDRALAYKNDLDSFLDAFCDAPLMYAGLGDLQLQQRSGSFIELRRERDLQREAALALMSMLSDFHAGKMQTTHERAVGKYLEDVVEAAVQRDIERADDRGEFYQ